MLKKTELSILKTYQKNNPPFYYKTNNNNIILKKNNLKNLHAI